MIANRLTQRCSDAGKTQSNQHENDADFSSAHFPVSASLRRIYVLLALAAVIALPAVWVLLTHGLPIIADDTPVHLMRLYLFDQHVRAGDLLPRWLPELYTGYGYPLFTFYAPAMYYVAEWLHLTGASLVDSYRLTFALAVIVGAVGAAFLGAGLYENKAIKRLGDWRLEIARASESPNLQSPISNLSIPNLSISNLSISAALLTATAYTYTLYLLANVYVRGAFAEVGAQALLPWLFWAWRGVMRSPRHASWLALAATLLALLAATHTITFLLTLPCLVAYVIVLAAVRRNLALLAAPTAAAGVAALLSAVIWLPQLLERSNLSTAAWSTQLLLDHLWRWQDFLALDLRFRAVDGGQTPYHFGAVQVWLLLAGSIFTRRRTAEWWFWLGVLGVCILLMSPLSAPLWASFPALAVIQFPWRLLSIAGLATALLGAGAVTALSTPVARASATALAVAFIVITQTPRAAETPHMVAPSDVRLSPAALARFEMAESAFGAGYDDEFLPRWANPVALAEIAPASPPVTATVTANDATGGDLHLTIDAPQPFALRWRQFYFPQVSAALDAVAPLVTAPAARTGLVEMSVPANVHTLDLQRGATLAQQAGLALSVFGVALLAFMLALGRAWKALTVTATVAMAMGLVWGVRAMAPPPLEQETIVDLPYAAAPGLDLVGITATIMAGDRLQLAPTWFVRTNQPDLLAHWTVRAADGRVVSEIESAPRFGVWRSATWAPGEVVQDAAELALPPGLPAGLYTVTLAWRAIEDDRVASIERPLLTVSLPALPAIAPTHVADATFGAPEAPVATLSGLRVAVEGAPMEGRFRAAPGDRVSVDLLWQPLTPDRAAYQSFVEIVDAAQQKVAGQDLQVGWRDTVRELWQPYLAPHEGTTLTLPEDAASGLYSVRVGLRDRRTGELLTAFDTTGALLGDLYTAAEFKVLASSNRRPLRKRTATFGDQIALEGYTQASDTTVRAGDALTVTLFYRARNAMPTDYTRFLQLYSPAHGMAAQGDAMPQAGANPTSAWEKGERVAETVVLHVAPNAAPGVYRLLLGFYDAASGVRLPAVDGDGLPAPDQAIELMEIKVTE
ncbi:MAG TPA: hypothetical protein DCL15_21665 [Chloroflexi bacterium]|nr:hypothetical protein [Chloroflexota bacterium]HHW87021.1 hypothetical protein [Chloroflexota bacterium]